MIGADIKKFEYESSFWWKIYIYSSGQTRKLYVEYTFSVIHGTEILNYFF